MLDLFKTLFLVSTFSIISSCGGGGGGSDSSSSNTGVDATISSTTPADGETNVSPETIILAQFSEDMLGSSIDTSSFGVSGSSTVSGAVSFDGGSNEATFMPDNHLSLLTNYEARLETTITNLSGDALAAPYSWHFTTADGSWGTPELIETNNQGAVEAPQISVNAAGDGIAVWQQSDGMRVNIWSNRYDATTDSWGSAELIETGNTGDADAPQIAIDTAGNGIAVWHQLDNMRINIWSNRYDATTDSWGTAELLETDDAGNAQEAKIVVDSEGNGIAVWDQRDSNGSNIWSRLYDAGTNTWGTPKLVEIGNNAIFGGDSAAVAVNAAGNAIAVWRHTDGILSNSASSRYDAATGNWSAPEFIEMNAVVNYQPKNHQIALNATGNAIAAWIASKPSTGGFDVWYNQYDAVRGEWGTPELVSFGSGDARLDDIAFDSAGNGMMIWQQVDNNQINLWSKRFDSQTGTWGEPQSIEDGAGNAFAAKMSIDAADNILAIFSQDNSIGVKDIWSNRYNAISDSWGTAQLVEMNNVDEAFVPKIGVNGAGEGIAIWYQEDGIRENLWANRFE